MLANITPVLCVLICLPATATIEKAQLYTKTKLMHSPAQKKKSYTYTQRVLLLGDNHLDGILYDCIPKTYTRDEQNSATQKIGSINATQRSSVVHIAQRMRAQGKSVSILSEDCGNLLTHNSVKENLYRDPITHLVQKADNFDIPAYNIDVRGIFTPSTWLKRYARLVITQTFEAFNNLDKVYYNRYKTFMSKPYYSKTATAGMPIHLRAGAEQVDERIAYYLLVCENEAERNETQTNAEDIVIIACGTAHADRIAQHFLEKNGYRCHTEASWHLSLDDLNPNCSTNETKFEEMMKTITSLDKKLTTTLEYLDRITSYTPKYPWLRLCEHYGITYLRKWWWVPPLMIWVAHLYTTWCNWQSSVCTKHG